MLLVVRKGRADTGNPPSAARAAATPFQKGGFWKAVNKKGSFLKGAVAAGG